MVGVSSISQESTFQVQIQICETTNGEGFKLFINNEYIDFPLFFEKLLSSNDADFPVIMDFLKINKISPPLCDIHSDIGYSFINNNFDISSLDARWKLTRNLKYLKENNCNINLEMFNFLRSLTFGGSLVKRGENYIEILQLIVPYLTDFFTDQTYWKKISYFRGDTKEIVHALRFLIENFGTESNFKYLPKQHAYNPFSLKHLSRNKVRDNIYKDKTFNATFHAFCEINLPVILFDYINFLN